VPEVAWSPALKENDGIGICPLGSWVVFVTVVVVIVVAVVVVICSCRPAPTVLGQVAKLLAVSAFWCTRTVMVEVTLGASRFSCNTPKNHLQRSGIPNGVLLRNTQQ
ncbi:hypothetical protein Tco_0279840, partial [Tanacetum coccineum]